MCVIKHVHFYIVEYILSKKKIDVNKTLIFPDKEINEDDEKTNLKFKIK